MISSRFTRRNGASTRTAIWSGTALLVVTTILLAGCGDKSASTGNLDSERSEAVKEAWRQEAILVKTEATATRDWDDAEKREMIETGKVKGYQGHHINSVSAHPKLAANSDNIKFVKQGQEHIESHGGDFRNPTDGRLLNRSGRVAALDDKTGYTGDNPGLKGLTSVGSGAKGVIHQVLPAEQASGLVKWLGGLGVVVLGWFSIRVGPGNAAAVGAGCLVIIVVVLLVGAGGCWAWKKFNPDLNAMHERQVNAETELGDLQEKIAQTSQDLEAALADRGWVRRLLHLNSGATSELKRELKRQKKQEKKLLGSVSSLKQKLEKHGYNGSSPPK
jgi:hypothetical protein